MTKPTPAQLEQIAEKLNDIRESLIEYWDSLDYNNPNPVEAHEYQLLDAGLLAIAKAETELTELALHLKTQEGRQ